MRVFRIILDTYISAAAPPLCHIKSIDYDCDRLINTRTSYPSSERTLTAIKLAVFATPYWLPPAIPLNNIHESGYFWYKKKHVRAVCSMTIPIHITIGQPIMNHQCLRQCLRRERAHTRILQRWHPTWHVHRILTIKKGHEIQNTVMDHSLTCWV